MSYNPSASQRNADLEFLKRLIERGRTRSMGEGNQFLTIIDVYPVETWYLCRELNPAFYHEVDAMIGRSLKSINATLN